MILTVVVAVFVLHPPDPEIELVIVYVPAVLLLRTCITPVLGSIIKPAGGLMVKIPPLVAVPVMVGATKFGFPGVGLQYGVPGYENVVIFGC